MTDTVIKFEKKSTKIEKTQSKKNERLINAIEKLKQEKITQKSKPNQKSTIPTMNELEKTGLVGIINTREDKKRKLKEVEIILQSGLNDLYNNLNNDQKKIFKARGEDAANKIVLILRPEDAENKTYLLKIFNWLNIFIILLRWLRIIRIKNLNNKHTIQKKTKKIISIIKSWLSISNIKNRFYIEQCAKIKTDELIKLTRSW